MVDDFSSDLDQFLLPIHNKYTLLMQLHMVILILNENVQYVDLDVQANSPIDNMYNDKVVDWSFFFLEWANSNVQMLNSIKTNQMMNEQRCQIQIEFIGCTKIKFFWLINTHIHKYSNTSHNQIRMMDNRNNRFEFI